MTALELSYPSLEAVQTERASRSLHSFIRYGWEAIDPAPYCDNWHIEVICEHLEAVIAGQIRNLLINIPPRHMKSLGTSVALPAWVWQRPRKANLPLQGPQVKFLFASYAQALSVRDSVKCRRVLESPWYKDRWGHRFQLTGDQNTKTRFDNDRGGYRLATSVDGALTGEGGDIIVVDDPHNVTEIDSEATIDSTVQWWEESMSTRLNDKRTGAFIMIMQRISNKDLAGRIIAREADRWTHLCLPARYERAHPYVYGKDPRKKEGEPLWKERFPDHELKDLERRMGSFAIAGQLQQRPQPREGRMFKRHWFEVVDAVPAVVRKRVRAWDLAATSEQESSDPDFTCGLKMSVDADGIYYIEDVIYEREAGLAVERLVRNTAKQDGKRAEVWIPQDPAQAGKVQAKAYIRALAGFIVKTSPVSKSGDKPTRAGPWCVQAEAGNIKLLRGAWNEPFLDSVCIFPGGTHDDDVDAASLAFEGITGVKPKRLVRPVEHGVHSPFSE